MMKQSMACIAVLLASQVVASQGSLLRRGTPLLQEEAMGDNYDTSGHYHHRVLEQGPGGIPSIVEGKLGNLGVAMKQAGNE